LISNKEIIGVNQAWAGHSGSPFKNSTKTVVLEDYRHVINNVVHDHEGAVPSTQYFYKPVGNKTIAILLMNHDDHAQDLTVDFSDIPGLECSWCKMRCLYERKDLGRVYGSFTAKNVSSHDSRFFVVSPADSSDFSEDIQWV